MLGVIGAAWKNIKQILAGIASLFSWSFVEDIIPDWFLRITLFAIPKALAGDTPEDQIEGSVILIGWSIATSLFTGGVTIGFVLFWSIFLFVGIIRFSDWGSGGWDSITSFSLPGVGSGGRFSTRSGRKER